MSIPSAGPALGAALALTASLLWAFSALGHASAGRRAGSFPVVLLRSALASVLLSAALAGWAAFSPGAAALPAAGVLVWLTASGVIGIGAGDAFLYEAYVTLGPRRSNQAMTVIPILTTLAGWFLLDETLPWRAVAGIGIVLAATTYAVLARASSDAGSREPGRVTPRGLAFAGAGILCVSIGGLALRHAFRIAPDLDPLAASTLRMVTATAALWAIPVVRGRVRATFAVLADRRVLSRLVPATFAGTFLGLICYVAAFKHLEAGLVSTLTFITPLWLLPIIAIRYRTRFKPAVVLATLAAVGGVALICVR